MWSSLSRTLTEVVTESANENMSRPSTESISVEELRKQLDEFKNRHGFVEPDRGNLDDPSINWRKGKPVYLKADLEYFKGKSMNHPKGSLAETVENLVKTWEMEMSHKMDLSQWKTTETDFKLSANGGRVFVGEDAKGAGNYIALMDDQKKELFDAHAHTWESSQQLFRGTFKNGFPWEVITVFSGPPKVVFSWRHWATFDGEYKQRKGDNEIYEMYGLCEAIVNDNMKIESIEVFYKPQEWLEALEQEPEERE